MKHLFFGFCAFCLLFTTVSWGCSDPPGPCSQDYNCPEGLYCVRGACTTEKPKPQPGKEPSKSEPAEEKPAKDAAVQPEPKIEKGPVKCSSSDDCTEPGKPVCWKAKSKCVRGYLTINFTKGYSVINPTAPARQCQNNAQCRQYQVCSRGQCFLGTGRSNDASGKFMGDGISLTDVSYAFVTKNEKGESVLRSLIFTTYSEKLTKMFEFDIPIAKVAKGAIAVDGTTVTGRYIDRLTEFSPEKREVIANAKSGIIKLTNAGTNEGASFIGTAEFEL